MTRFKWFQRPDHPVDYVAGEPVSSTRTPQAEKWVGKVAAPGPEKPLMTKAGALRPSVVLKRLNQR
ncbi:hypothetical protein TPA0908_20580 [Micromonospora sp. AKA38]|nr:hypothetical protein TPA0908_20580 [Micromonospora sp. AKA38]